MIIQTRKWCAERHSSQLYGAHAYSYHLHRVESVAVRFGIVDLAFRQACWGHDLLEDTETTIAEMREAGFLDEAISLCLAVTDEPGSCRKERKAKTYPKIRATPRATLLKLCDRIANVEESLRTNGSSSSKLATYRAEHEEFRKQLFSASDKIAAPLWEHLDILLAE